MKKSPNKLQKRRNDLLAICHIAPRQLGIDDETRREILANNWGVTSSAALSVKELEAVVAYYEQLGFVRRPKKRREPDPAQLAALRDRVLEEAARLENGEARMLGLLKSKAGVDRLEWCRDAGKLKQVLRLLREFREKDAKAVAG